MKNNIRHIGLVVKDINKSLDFWINGMGFSTFKMVDESGDFIDNMMNLENVNVTTAKLIDSNGSMLEILKFHSHPDDNSWNGKPYSTGLTHIALTVSSLDDLIERLLSYGVAVDRKPQISPDGKAKVIYVEGPEALLLELVEEQ